MGIVYKSPRQTADIDYSTILDPDPKIADQLKESLNAAFPAVSARLGYPNIICRIQTVKLMPRPEGFADKQFPGFKITVAYAERGSGQEDKLLSGKGARVLHADVSFKEPVGGFQIVRLGEHRGTISAYSLKDIITEKYRAFLQQEKRNRRRRQDIYDLSILLNRAEYRDLIKDKTGLLEYQQEQARDVFSDCDYIISFSGLERCHALFFGVFAVNGKTAEMAGDVGG